MLNKYIDRFMPSEEMKEYLKNEVSEEVLQHSIVGLIYNSPAPVEEKLYALKELQPFLVQEYGKNECRRAIWNIEEALGYIAQDGVLVLESCVYSYEKKNSDSNFEAVCATFEDVEACIRKDLAEGKVSEHDLRWYEISKWMKNKTGKYIQVSSYVIFRDKIIYTLLEDNGQYDFMDFIDWYHDAENLNLPVPFHPGDIIEVDGYPFGPKMLALIVSIGDNCDCCCVQAIAQNEDGEWGCGALKHGMVGPQYFPKLSPLYTAKICEQDMNGDYLILKRLNKFWEGENDDR